MARRSIDPDGSSVGMPATWLRKPWLTKSSERVMPDLASRRVARTSWLLLPMDETMPIPVTTTRLMAEYPHLRTIIVLGHIWATRGGPARVPDRTVGNLSSAARQALFQSEPA